VKAGPPRPPAPRPSLLTASAEESFIGAGAGLRSSTSKGSGFPFSAATARRAEAGRASSKKSPAAGWRPGGPVQSWPAPFVYFSRRPGVFLAETADGEIDLASGAPVWSGFGRGRAHELYVIAGSSPLEMNAAFRP